MSRSRFGSYSPSKINEMVENLQPKNTKRSKASVWCQFQQFCKDRNVILDSSLSVTDLAALLKDWAANMKRKNGEEYKEAVVKLMWNSTAKQLQEFYFKNFGVKFNPFVDVEFVDARTVRDAKRRLLQSDVRKRTLSSVALTREELLKMVKIWDENTPNGLQRKFFLIAAFELAWRGGEGSSCRVHYFHEEKSNDGVPTGRVEYNPVFTKTTQGGSKKLADSKWLTTNTADPDLCPVRLLKKLLEKRTHFITTDKLFLAPNPNWQCSSSKGWYKNMPIGKNYMAKWLCESADKIGIDTKKMKVTNHSIRASAVSHLAKQGVGEEQLIKVTGHHHVHSIKPYLQMDSEHHQKIIGALRSDQEPRETSSTIVTASVSASSHTSSSSSNMNSNSVVNNYNNCVFNFGC